MNIPDKLKIGGLTYSVYKSDVIILGPQYTGEIDYGELIIRLRNRAPQMMERTLWHEIFHGIYDNLGYVDHDEKHIDELAGALYQLIVDNPELFRGQEQNSLQMQ